MNCSRSSLKISPEGELIDRWGTPYFVHPMSEGIVEFRSGGPDKTLWTDDDIMSPLPQQVKRHIDPKNRK